MNRLPIGRKSGSRDEGIHIIGIIMLMVAMVTSVGHFAAGCCIAVYDTEVNVG